MSAVISMAGAGKAFDGRKVLTNVSAEIGAAEAERLTVTPFRGKSHDPAHRFL